MKQIAKEFSFVDEVTGEVIEGRRVDTAFDYTDASDIKKATVILTKHHNAEVADLLLADIARDFKVTAKGNLLYV